MTESQWVGLLAIAAGAFGMTASIMDWDWFMNSRKARAWVKRIGRNNARGMYLCISSFVALVGLFMLIFAPGGDSNATADHENTPTPQADSQTPDQTIADNRVQPPPEVYENAPDAFRDQFTSDPRRTSSTPDDSQDATNNSRPANDVSTPTTPASPATKIEIPEGGIDLLPLIDPARDQLVADWTMQDGHLISPTAQPAILQVPIELPESYTVTAVVEELKVTANGSLSLGVNVAGSGVSIVIAGTQGDTSGLQLVDNKITRQNSTHRRGPVMKAGQNQIVCSVDGPRLKVQVNGDVIIDWNDDPSRLSYGYEAKKGRKDQLKVGSWAASYRISRLWLVPN